MRWDEDEEEEERKGGLEKRPLLPVERGIFFFCGEMQCGKDRRRYPTKIDEVSTR